MMHCRGAQRRDAGQAILMLLFILGVAAAAFVYQLTGTSRLSLKLDNVTNQALAEAREALIAYATFQSTTTKPGGLPCPDTNNDGTAEGYSGNACPSYIGRLPFRTLGITDLRDGVNERLWYALSPNFRNRAVSASGPILNPDTSAQLTVTGLTPYSNVIAIVFSPGQPLGTQTRSSTTQNTVSNYLEGENNNGDYTYTTEVSSGTFNDRLMPITADAFWPPILARVGREIRTVLTTYYNSQRYYPYANSYSDGTYGCTAGLTEGRLPVGSLTGCGITSYAGAGAAFPTWFTDNNWNLVTFYAVAPACIKTSTNCSGTPFLNVTGLPSGSYRALVILTGPARSGQSRSCASVADCLDDTENTNGDYTFLNPTVGGGVGNDRLIVVAP